MSEKSDVFVVDGIEYRRPPAGGYLARPLFTIKDDDEYQNSIWCHCPERAEMHAPRVWEGRPL